jgi:hypothetical protein
MAEQDDTSLLVDGIRLYSKALGALNDFQRMVTETIRKVVGEELGGLSTAMGTKLAKRELTNYVKPNRIADFNGKWASLWVRIDRSEKVGWCLNFAISWLKDEANVKVSIWLNDETQAKSIASALKKLSSRAPVQLESCEVYIHRVLPPEEAEQFPVVLRELIREFSELWTKAGGMDKVLKAKAARA